MTNKVEWCPYLDPYGHDGYWEMNCKFKDDEECHMNYNEPAQFEPCYESFKAKRQEK